jgi:hypothetical protein
LPESADAAADGVRLVALADFLPMPDPEPVSSPEELREVLRAIT